MVARALRKPAVRSTAAVSAVAIVPPIARQALACDRSRPSAALALQRHVPVSVMSVGAWKCATPSPKRQYASRTCTGRHQPDIVKRRTYYMETYLFLVNQGRADSVGLCYG
jgi:hypothetical protein